MTLHHEPLGQRIFEQNIGSHKSSGVIFNEYIIGRIYFSSDDDISNSQLDRRHFCTNDNTLESIGF